MTRALALRRRVIGALSLLIFVSTASAQDDEPAEKTRPFALPLARDARTNAEKATDHIRAQRWSEGIVVLQRLLEEHRGEVLPESYRDTFELNSWNEAHPGAADWARRQLLRLPREARELYREFRIDQVSARRAINCNASRRGPVPEVVVRNYA